MDKPITITATVAAWLPAHKKPHELVDLLKAGDATRLAGSLWYYGAPDKAAFGDWTRVGEADITLRLLSEDEQVRMAVSGLQRQLEEARAAWLTKQQEILAEISKLQALSFEPAEVLEA
jgi:hypothetical protein